MYGKHFAAMYSGSMYGAGINVFAVWGYALANVDKHGYVELNVKMLAQTLGGTETEVENAIQRLCAPDPDSRSPREEGRRLTQEGRFLYHMVNYEEYRQLQKEADRREYLRIKQQEHRERARGEGVNNRQQVSKKVNKKRYADADVDAVSKGKSISPSNTQVVQDRPASATPNLPVQRDHNWVEAFINQLETKDWQTNRAVKEAVVAFKFHRWMNKITNRQVFSQQRERSAVKLLQSYGLVRCLLAIEGQRTHPDFNQEDRGRYYRGWDNLFRADKGFENIEKCSDHAIQRGDFKATLRALAQLQQERGWTPTPADEELFSTIGGDK